MSEPYMVYLKTRSQVLFVKLHETSDTNKCVGLTLFRTTFTTGVTLFEFFFGSRQCPP